MLWMIEIVFSQCRIWIPAPEAEDWGIKSNNLVYLPFILYDFIISSRECKSQHVCSTGCLFEFVTSQVPSWCYTITTFLAFVTKLSFQSLDLYYMLEGETFCQRLFWASKTFSRKARKLQKIKSFYFQQIDQFSLPTNLFILFPSLQLYTGRYFLLDYLCFLARPCHYLSWVEDFISDSETMMSRTHCMIFCRIVPLHVWQIFE